MTRVGWTAEAIRRERPVRSPRWAPQRPWSHERSGRSEDRREAGCGWRSRSARRARRPPPRSQRPERPRPRSGRTGRLAGEPTGEHDPWSPSPLPQRAGRLRRRSARRTRRRSVSGPPSPWAGAGAAPGRTGRRVAGRRAPGWRRCRRATGRSSAVRGRNAPVAGTRSGRPPRPAHRHRSGRSAARGTGGRP